MFLQMAYTDRMMCKRHICSVLKFSFLFGVVLFIFNKWSENRNITDSVKNITLIDTHYKDRLSKQYDLRIIAIVFNRAESLQRLLNSLNEADYYNDLIKLEVWIDRSKTGQIDQKVLNVSNNFNFKHGEFSVYTQPTHVGIFGQWLKTWMPVENSSEIAVILEDDCVVSLHFYKYLKLVHNKYDKYPSVNGYALQGVSIKHSRNGGLLEAPYENHVFLYPVLGTWGFSPNKLNWIKFLNWFRSAYQDNHFKPYVPGNVVTTWYQSFERRGKQTGMWSIWHIYFAWKNNEYTLYSNFKGHEGLTANWKESGLHYSKGSNSKQSNPLLTIWKSEFDNLPDNPLRLNLNESFPVEIKYGKSSFHSAYMYYENIVKDTFFTFPWAVFRHWTMKSLPNNKILDLTKLGAFVDDKINKAQAMISVFDRVENIVGKGENAG